MFDTNRRAMLRGALGLAGATATSGATASATTFAQSSATGGISASMITAIEQQLSSLSGSIGKLAMSPPALRDLFRDGAVITERIGPGRYIAMPEPTRALVLLPVRHHDVSIDVPVVVNFTGRSAGDLRIASLALASGNPIDALRSPSAEPDSAVRADDLQARYNQLATAGGGVLTLPPGTFAVNLVLHSRTVHLTGSGRRATQLVPRDPKQPVIRAAYREGSWDYVTIANLDIAGAGGHGIGFAAGADAYVVGDEFAGRTRLVNIGFSDLDISVQRRAGQIGLLIDQCGFRNADYHLISVANPAGKGEAMHAGIFTARDSHFTGARVAVAHFDSPTAGTGAVLFDNCIMERNSGFVFHVEAFADVDASTDFVVRDCWNELNATAREVTINGRREKVCYASLRDAGMVRFDGTPLGSLTLRNAVVDTYRCPLDNLQAIDSDPRSSIRHHEARGFGSYAPLGLTTSVAAAAQSDPPGRALCFILPHRKSLARLDKDVAHIASRGDVPIRLTGTDTLVTQPANDAVLPDTRTSQRIQLRQGMQLFPAPVAVPENSWLVWLFAYKRLSGGGTFFQVSGDRGVSSRRAMDSSAWQTLGGMAELAQGARELSLWMLQDEGAADILLGGHNLLSFDTRQRAVDFLNSGNFAI